MNEIITQIVESEDLHIYQGEFIKNVEFIEDFSEKDGNIEISIINFPLVAVLTQECDSTQDYKNRLKDYQKRKETNGKESIERNQYLLSIMVAPVYLLEDVKEGKHLEHLGHSCRTISSSEIKKIKQNAVIRNTIEAVEKEFEGNGRVLIRASGTEPLVRVMIEGTDQEYITEKAKSIAELIEQRLS